jgi:hypothetical protein
VSGYIQYLLCEDGVKRYFYAHRLVAMAFIPNLEDLPEVNHINEVKTDNRVENLEWCDSKYNNNFGTKNKRGNANNDRKYCEQNRKLVNQYDLDGNLVATFEGMRVASKATGVLEQSISKCCRGLISQTAGTKWAYA